MQPVCAALKSLRAGNSLKEEFAMQFTVTYGIAEYKSEDYGIILKLREDVMRKPIGLTLTEKDIVMDAGNIHVWQRINGQIIGTAMLVPKANGVFQMRMVALRPQARGLGLGACLVRYCEGLAAGMGYTKIELDSRETAHGFYERLGYKTHGEVYLHVGIPHVFMDKKL